MIEDIYFEEEYAKLNLINGESVDIFHYECEYGKVRYLFIKREIDILQENHIDIITPYGYGGPEFEHVTDKEKLIKNYLIAFEEYCNENKIVSEFIRFHPLFENYLYMNQSMKLVSDSSTIFIDLESNDVILKNMDRKCRGKFRKAEKNGLVVMEDKELSTLNKFAELYSKTMDKNEGSIDYYFSEKYYQRISKLNGFKLFNVYMDDEIVASTMILAKNKLLHYHLSANTPLGYQLAANNLLLYKISLYGLENGYDKFHLGGGFGGDLSSLYKFKKSFNKNGALKFYTGRKIHNNAIYKELLENRMKENPNIEYADNGFFPLYRK